MLEDINEVIKYDCKAIYFTVHSNIYKILLTKSNE